MSLKVKIVVPVLLLLLASTIIITSLNYSQAKTTVDRMVGNILDAGLETFDSQVKRATEIENVINDEINSKNIGLTRSYAEILRLNAELGTSILQNIPQQQRIADMLGVSEVHAINSDAVLIGGNISDYYDFDFSSGEQTRPFLRILEDPSYELAQEPQPNASYGRMFQYIGVARTDEKGIVQIGHTAQSVQAFKDILDVSNVARDMKIGATGSAKIIENGFVTYSENSAFIGRDARGEDWYKKISSGRGKYEKPLEIDGKMVYTGYSNVGDMTMLVMFPEKEYKEYLTPVLRRGILGSLISFLVMLALVLILTNHIVQPINTLSHKLSAVALGEFNANLATNEQDEVGVLSRDIMNVIDIFMGLGKEIKELSHELSKNGDIERRIDTSRYNGFYKEMAESINTMVAGIIDDIMEMLRCVTAFGHGEDAHIRSMPGKQAIITQTFNTLEETMDGLAVDITKLSENVAKGNLEVRVDTTKYEGGWAVVTKGLNDVVDAVAKPLAEIEHALTEMSKGNFTHMNGDYKGVFDVVKRTANKTVDITLTYVEEIAKTLEAMSQGDLNVSVQHQYMGSYAPIKQALTTILDSLNNTMSDITAVADQVLSGAELISHSAMSLAEGSGNQASAIEELTASIEEISTNTKLNSESTDKVNEFAQQSVQHVHQSSEVMESMATNMDSIRQSSLDISKIIKSIEDIAFQTNLLALNAAVEAARAGEHGKGFSVVAEEVRNLASKSQQSAQDTTSIIEDSNSKVEGGMDAAKKAVSALETIVTDMQQISDLIAQIAEMTHRQADAITQINAGMGEITRVVQENSSTSQECAAASQELNSQAEIMNKLVSFFKLKR